jgi:hypothetical protein
MSRRFVSVCVLAFATIAGVFTGWTGRSNPRRFSREIRNAKIQPREVARAPVGRANHALRPSPRNFAAAKMRCAESQGCAAPLTLPMTFEPNTGQFDPRVKYVGRGGGISLLLTRNGMDVTVGNPLAQRGARSTTEIRVRFRLVQSADAQNSGKNCRFMWRGEGRVRAVSNYFIGPKPSAWRLNVPHFARAAGQADSEGRLGVAIYGTSRGVEYDLRLAPGADASKLRLRFSGAAPLQLDSGNLNFRVGNQIVRMGRPRVYQQLRDGKRKAVRGKYILEADGTVGFETGPHDPSAVLVIDPSLSVAYATFLGGSGNETAGNVAVDSSGKVYVSGVTNSATTFPEAGATDMGPVLGASAFYVAKIDPAATGANSLIYLAFLGGSGTQSGGLIALDAAGDVAVTGTTTSSDYPVTGSSKPTNGLTSGDANDVVISEINAAGNQLNFSTYFGGSGRLSANGPGGIAMDATDRVYIASDVQPSAADPSSPDLPVTAGAFQTAWDGETSDAFLAVFSPPAQTGGAASLTYCTYLGTNSSAGPVIIGGVAVDSNGNAYIGGSTSNAANGFPAQNAFQSAYGGGSSDGFVMKIAPAGSGSSDLVYATLLGGSGMDEVLAISIDSSLAPKAYVTGETQSSDFPITASSAYQTKLRANPLISGSANAFLAVIAQDAVSGQTSLAYSSYLGGSDVDTGLSIAVATPTSVYLAGQTNSTDFPWRDNLQPFNGSVDAFLAKFDPASAGAASLVYATPLGGTSPPGGAVSAEASGVAASATGQVYVAGETTAADFPTALTTSEAANGFQQSCASCQEATSSGDAFLLAITENATAGPSVYFNTGSENFGSSNLGSALSGQPIAVLNSGEQNLTISDIEVLGPNAADFSTVGQSACIGASISPGPAPQCSMDVTFTPSIGGPEEAFLAVTDNAPGSPQLLELKGTGDAPHAQVLPASLSFGDQPVNTVSAGQIVTITNTGNENLSMTGEVFSPVGAPFQSQDITCNFPQSGWALAPGASCTMMIAFAPTATGQAQGQVQILDNSDFQSDAQQLVSLSGNGVTPAPLADLNPKSVTFGSTVVGSSSAPQSVTLQNQGSAALDVTSVSIGGTNAADFEIASAGTTCPITGGTVPTGTQCTVVVQFAPQSAGSSKSATLSFADNAAGSPQVVALSGVATTPASLTVSPGSVSFGSQSEGTSSAAQIVTITNSGAGDAGVSGIAIAGSSDFTQQNACPPVLTAGSQCQVTVTFAPAESAMPGARSATLKIPGGNPASVALSGTATQAAISFTASLSFASQLVGTTGAPQPITITNSSSGSLAGALALSAIGIGGTNKADFSIAANQCSDAGEIAPGNSCTVQIAFQPQPAATCGDDPDRSASLQLSDNAPGSPQTISLSGSAADFCLASANGQPVTTPIQPGQTASYSLEVASAGGFAGTVNLSCTAPAVAGIGPCAITTSPATNPPSVQVTPAAAGQFTVNVPTVAPGAASPSGPSNRRRHDPLAVGFALLMCMLLLASGAFAGRAGFGDPRRRRLVRLFQLMALSVGLAVALAACGSGGGSDPASSPGTAPGTYTITVTATTTGPSTTTRTASLTMTVE